MQSNHLVEQALDAAVGSGDLNPFLRLHCVLADPCREQAGCADLARPPTPVEEVQRTYCGT